jgi:hypothetical protein
MPVEHRVSPASVCTLFCPSFSDSNGPVTSREIERQDACVKAFDKMFFIAPELLHIIKQIYLEITVKPQQWQMLVNVVCRLLLL